MGWELCTSHYILHIQYQIYLHTCPSPKPTKKMPCRITSNKKPIQSLLSPSSLTFSSFVLMLYCTCTSVFRLTYVVIPSHTHITGLISAYWREHMFSGFSYTFISGYTVMLSKDFCLNYLCSCEFSFFFFISPFSPRFLDRFFFSKRKEKGNTC